MADTVNVAYAIDHRYVLPLAVSVRSVVDACSRPDDLRFLVLGRGLEEEHRDAIRSSCGTAAAEVAFADVGSADFGGLADVGYISNTMFARLWIPDLAPTHWHRALYLDADTVVRGDLAELWATDLAGNAVGAIEDDLVEFAAITRYPEHLADMQRRRYFNSGVMLMDLDRWRRDRIGQAAFDFARDDERSITGCDQEALNIVIGPQWTEIDPAWNVLSHFYIRPRSRRRYAAALADVKLRHFTSQFKPWLPAPRALDGAEWFYASLDRTVFAGQRPGPFENPLASGWSATGGGGAG